MRIGLDLDGVLADFSAAFAEIAERLYGPCAPAAAARRPTEAAPAIPAAHSASPTPAAPRETGPEPSTPHLPPAATARARPAHPLRLLDPWPDAEAPLGLAPHQVERVWREIRAVPDFWTTLRPIGADVLPRLHALTVARGWEVLFLTRRPATAGQTVQRQTQQWLTAHGFALPSVLTVSASRGKVADALDLDVLVDDSIENCMDVRSDSRAVAVLIWADDASHVHDRARGLGIGVVRSMAECLDRLEQLADGGALRQTLLARLRARLGLRS